MIKRDFKKATCLIRGRWFAGAFCCLLTSSLLAQSVPEQPLDRCGTVEFERVLQRRNPQRLQQINELNRLIQQEQIAIKSGRRQLDDSLYRIPIVVHVIHKTASGEIGGPGNGNISDQQILSQIEVLNEDYRRRSGTNGFNTSPIGADAHIEFYLATTDPSGQPTNGITRHYYPQKTSFDVFSDNLLLSQIAYWPSDQYLNIWVTTVDKYLGFTQFPTVKTDTLSGLRDDVNALIDGSIIDYHYFGRQVGTVTSSIYGLGRTTTHEIGHWLGLFHPNNDIPCGDDFVADTPPTDNLNQTTSCNDLFSNCSGKRTRELTENYLMYSPDPCMNMFTVDQVARMRAVLRLSPRRARVVNSASSVLGETEQLTITVYPNPASLDPSVDVQLKGSQSFSVDLLDIAGRLVRTDAFAASPSTRVPLSIKGLAPGIYILRVKTDSEFASKRLVVQ